MIPLSSGDLQNVGALAYGLVALAVGIESIGIPFPGESVLIAAALYAGTARHLSIVLIVVAAACGAILGDNVGFLLGRRFGFPLLVRFGHFVHLTPARIKIGQFLFLRHGGKVVFFGRFLAILRTTAAFLAGTNQMKWLRFLIFNAAGGVCWAPIYGFGAYYFGSQIHRFSSPVEAGVSGVALLTIVVILAFLRRNETRLSAKAERSFPGRPEYIPNQILTVLGAARIAKLYRDPGSEDDLVNPGRDDQPNADGAAGIGSGVSSS